VKYFLMTLLLASFAGAGDDLDKKVQEIKEETKALGDDSIPVSDQNKKFLDDAFKSPRKTKKEKKDSQRYSLDCKTWVDSVDRLVFPGSNQKEKKFVQLYFQEKTGEIGYFNDENQSIINLANNTYFKITDDASLLFDGRGPRMNYRPLKTTIRRNLVGMLQAMALLAMEMGDFWGTSIRDGEPNIMAIFINEKSSALQNYMGVICKNDGNCTMLLKKALEDGSRTAPLLAKSPAHAALVEKAMFSTKLQSVEQMCTDLTSEWFKRQVNQDFTALQSQCGLPKKDPFDLVLVADACNKIKSRLIPGLKKYQ
jgi:hypothetical protein